MDRIAVFFNLVNVPFMKQVDATMKPKNFQYLTLPTLNLFRWSALITASSDSGTGHRCSSVATPSAWAKARAAP